MTEKKKSNVELLADFKNSGYIVELNISVPSFTKQDRSVRDQLAIDKDAVPDVLNVSKKLLGTDPTYKALRKKANELRQFFRNNTLETNERARRFLSIHYHSEFAAKADKLINECRALEADLRTNWDQIRETAKHQLGKMFEDPGSCPPMHFGYEISTISDGRDFMSLPTDIVSKEMAKELAEKHAARTVRNIKSAHADLYAKLLAVAKRAADGLALDEEGNGKRFTHTLVEDLADVGKLGQALEVFDDDELAEIAGEMRKLGESVTPEVLREDEATRAETSIKANDLVTKLSKKSEMFFGRKGPHNKVR